MLPFQANFLLNKCFMETESISISTQQHTTHNNQLTTNIFLFCYPWNEKANSHTILNSDALSTDDALSR
jgi:hypothetical protein